MIWKNRLDQTDFILEMTEEVVKFEEIKNYIYLILSSSLCCLTFIV